MIYQQFVSVIYARSPHSIRERMETIHGNRPITIPDRAAPDPGTVRFLRGKGQGRTGEGDCRIRPAVRVGDVARRPPPGPTQAARPPRSRWTSPSLDKVGGPEEYLTLGLRADGWGNSETDQAAAKARPAGAQAHCAADRTGAAWTQDIGATEEV